MISCAELRNAYTLAKSRWTLKMKSMQHEHRKSQAARSHRQGVAHQLREIKSELSELCRDLGERLDCLIAQRREQREERDHVSPF
jgi:hypothetical protein